MAAQSTKSVAIDTEAGQPEWLDQVLGRLSPPFTFRRGGSAITGGTVADHKPAQQTTAAANGSQRG